LSRKRSPYHRRRQRGTVELFGFRLNLRRFIPFLFFLTVAIVSASLLINYAVHSVQRKQANDHLVDQYADAFLQDAEETPIPEPVSAAVPTPDPGPQLLSTYHTLSGNIAPSVQELHAQNNDLVGWLYIRGVVSLPVVYRDNEYYLDHDFNGKRSNGGTLFLDQYHPLTESAQHLLIHGHNMHDSSMFGILSSFNNLSVVQSNPFATFSSMYNAEEYVVFAVLRVVADPNSGAYFNYIGHPSFATVNEFYNFIDAAKLRSLFQIPVDVLPSDALLTLSTCIEDDRLVVMYRRIRDGETKEQLETLLAQSVRW